MNYNLLRLNMRFTYYLRSTIVPDELYSAVVAVLVHRVQPQYYNIRS